MTHEFFTGHPGGAAYGLTAVVSGFGKESRQRIHPRTPIPGLNMAGAAGVMGALWGGIVCAGHVPGGMAVRAALKAAGLHRTGP